MSCVDHSELGQDCSGPKVEGFAFALSKYQLQETLEHGTSFRQHPDKEKAILDGEYMLSIQTLKSGRNLGSLQAAYQSVDWRDKSNWLCNQGRLATRNGGYFGLSVHPYEALFHKSRWSDEAPVTPQYEHALVDWRNDRAARELQKNSRPLTTTETYVEELVPPVRLHAARQAYNEFTSWKAGMYSPPPNMQYHQKFTHPRYTQQRRAEWAIIGEHTPSDFDFKFYVDQNTNLLPEAVACPAHQPCSHLTPTVEESWDLTRLRYLNLHNKALVWQHFVHNGTVDGRRFRWMSGRK